MDYNQLLYNKSIRYIRFSSKKISYTLIEFIIFSQTSYTLIYLFLNFIFILYFFIYMMLHEKTLYKKINII
jgi:predicted PurR-regulated permease PerM